MYFPKEYPQRKKQFTRKKQSLKEHLSSDDFKKNILLILLCILGLLVLRINTVHAAESKTEKASSPHTFTCSQFLDICTASCAERGNIRLFACIGDQLVSTKRYKCRCMDEDE